MPRIGFRTRERLMDGTPDPDGVIPAGFFQLRAEGLTPGATLTVTLAKDTNQFVRTATADATGKISVNRQVTNAKVLAALETLGSAIWDDPGDTFTAASGDISLTIAVS